MALLDFLTLKQDFGVVLVGSIIFTASFLLRDFFADIQEKYFPKNAGIPSRLVFTLSIVALLVVAAGALRGVFGLETPAQPTTAMASSDADPFSLQNSEEENQNTTTE